MKFKIGQPVWAIGHCSRAWIPSIVTGIGEYELSQCWNCRTVIRANPVYSIERTDGERPPNSAPCFVAPGCLLRPRDPDQHTPASLDFELPLRVEA